MVDALISSRRLTYGGVPVPYSVSWSAEDGDWRVAPCPYAGRPAICQAVAPGQGKPRFGKPHSQRQRETIAHDLCDLCGSRLRNCTKVSLSHVRPQMHAAAAGDILQVEPLLHKRCAALSMQHCPSLRRDISAGTLCVRQVTRHAVQFAIMDELYTASLTSEHRRAVGHAKVQLLAWVDRDGEWLARGVDHV